MIIYFIYTKNLNNINKRFTKIKKYLNKNAGIQLYLRFEWYIL